MNVRFSRSLTIPVDREVRHYQLGDERHFREVMRLAGWPAKRLDYSLSCIIANGWFVAVEEQSKTVVGTAMCLHNYTGSLPFWGDLGLLDKKVRTTYNTE